MVDQMAGWDFAQRCPSFYRRITLQVNVPECQRNNSERRSKVFVTNFSKSSFPNSETLSATECENVSESDSSGLLAELFWVSVIGLLSSNSNTFPKVFEKRFLDSKPNRRNSECTVEAPNLPLDPPCR